MKLIEPQLMFLAECNVLGQKRTSPKNVVARNLKAKGLIELARVDEWDRPYYMLTKEGINQCSQYTS